MNGMYECEYIPYFFIYFIYIPSLERQLNDTIDMTSDVMYVL